MEDIKLRSQRGGMVSRYECQRDIKNMRVWVKRTKRESTVMKQAWVYANVMYESEQFHGISKNGLKNIVLRLIHSENVLALIDIDDVLQGSKKIVKESSGEYACIYKDGARIGYDWRVIIGAMVTVTMGGLLCMIF